MNLLLLVTIILYALKVGQSSGKRKRTQGIKHGTEFTTVRKDKDLPDSHKEALDEMLGAFLNDQDSDGSIFKYLFGLGNEKPSSIDFDNLDITTLDTDSIKKIVQRAKNKYDSLSTRRLNYLPKLALDLMPYPHKEYSQYVKNQEKRSALQKRKDYVVLAFDMMAQSIYTTRYRLIETKEFRKIYSKQFAYQIGVMIGSVMELKSKMAHIFANMYWMETRTHFIWYLILYEKMLTCHTDVTNQVDRIFIIHNQYVAQMRKSNKNLKKSNDTGIIHYDPNSTLSSSPFTTPVSSPAG